MPGDEIWSTSEEEEEEEEEESIPTFPDTPFAPSDHHTREKPTPQPGGDLQLFSQGAGVHIWQYLMELQVINDFHATLTAKGHFPQLFIFQQRHVQPFSEIPRA